MSTDRHSCSKLLSCFRNVIALIPVNVVAVAAVAVVAVDACCSCVLACLLGEQAVDVTIAINNNTKYD